MPREEEKKKRKEKSTYRGRYLARRYLRYMSARIRRMRKEQLGRATGYDKYLFTYITYLPTYLPIYIQCRDDVRFPNQRHPSPISAWPSHAPLTSSLREAALPFQINSFQYVTRTLSPAYSVFGVRRWNKRLPRHPSGGATHRACVCVRAYVWAQPESNY
ncbi:hypothetical protein F5Y11DRAFT_111556 [Daldinia sp. FL1419]|nr:hypothetical protein F5Y11DRAFT_111556 [Daldinia sp. FL1419]